MRFSRLSVALFIIFISVSAVRSQEASQDSQPVLMNSDVVQMVKSGFSPELVIAKIKASKTSFDTTPSILAELKQNGVPENVLVAMIEASSAVKASLPLQPDLHLESARSALKALRKIASATEVGVSYVNYSPLVAEVKAEVEDALSHMKDGNVKTSIQAALNEYTYAAYVWQATWRDDFISGPLKDVAIKKYGVQKKGLLKVVWRTDFLNAIWREARNQFEIANSVLSEAQTVSSTNNDSLKTKDDLLGTWKIFISGNNGQTIEFNLTIVQIGNEYHGTVRSPMGNSDNLQITKNGSSFTLYATEQEKKRTLSIKLEGTVDSEYMKGNITLSDGKQGGTLLFAGTRLAN